MTKYKYGHCCAEGALEHEYKAYLRQRENDRLLKRVAAKHQKMQRQANEEWRRQHPCRSGDSSI